jgi:hypothetical protein
MTTPEQCRQNALLKPAVEKSFHNITVYEVLHQYRNAEFTEAIPHELSLYDLPPGTRYFLTYADCVNYCNDVNELRKEIR